MKKKRNKPGYKLTDRVCRICGKTIPVDKCLNEHHISYSQDIKVPLCYMCHNLVHGRIKYGCPYDKKYGKDFGGYFRALAIFNLYQMYPKVLTEIIQKFGAEEIK